MRFNNAKEAIEAHKKFPRNFVCQDGLCNARIIKILKEISYKSKVLDAGCNDGQLGAVLINKLKCEVYGVDVSNLVKEEAVKNGVKFYNSTIEKMPFEKNLFGVVITAETLEHIFDLDVALKEIKRVLKPDGILVGTVPHPDVEDMDDE